MAARFAEADEFDWLASIALTSDYVHRGLAQSSENPALQAGIGVRNERGYYAHLWGSTLDTHRLAPDFGDRSAVEVDLVVGMARPLTPDVTWELTLGRYETFASSQILDYDYTEMGAALSFANRLRLGVAYAPRATDHDRDNRKLSGPRRVAEVAGSWPINPRWSVTGGVGHSDLGDVSDVAHWFWSASLNYQFNRYLLAAGVFGTDDNARERFVDGRADTRFVVSAIAMFGEG